MNHKRKRLHIWHAYSTNDALSNDTKVNDLVTLTLTFLLKKTFSESDSVAAGGIVFHKHTLIFIRRLVGTYYGMARASVRPSVCLSFHKSCKHDTDWTVPERNFKLGTLTTYDKRTNPIYFQGQGSKVKVTRNTLLLNLVNTTQAELFKLGLSNLVHILLMTRGRRLLISKVIGQRSRSHSIHCC